MCPRRVKKEKFEDMKKWIDKRSVILCEIINRVSAHGINNIFAQNAQDVDLIGENEK